MFAKVSSDADNLAWPANRSAQSNRRIDARSTAKVLFQPSRKCLETIAAEKRLIVVCPETGDIHACPITEKNARLFFSWKAKSNEFQNDFLSFKNMDDGVCIVILL
jgi:hypothetical protein